MTINEAALYLVESLETLAALLREAVDHTYQDVPVQEAYLSVVDYMPKLLRDLMSFFSNFLSGALYD